MPTNLFYELKDEKKKKIISVGIAEFAEYGYDNSSTNRIVKNSGISKGSLFKYFGSKEELYFYILDRVTAEMAADLLKQAECLPTDLFERVKAYSELEFSWYMQNPEKYRLIMKAFIKGDDAIYQKTEERYHREEGDIFDRLLEGTDENQLKWDRKKTGDILKWFLKGFNEDFTGRAEINSETQIENLKAEYVEKLTDYMEILKKGLQDQTGF